MKINKSIILCAALAAVLALSSCEGATPAPAAPDNTTTTTAATSAETSTTAADETTTTAEQAAAPEETTTTTAETAEPEPPQENTFPAGVYWAHCGAQWGDRYYEFGENGSGAVLNQELGIGAPFDYEIDGEDIVFHFFSADDSTPAKIEYENGIPSKLIFEYEEEQLLTYEGDISLDDFKYYTDYDISAMMRNYLRITGRQEPYSVMTSDTSTELIEVNAQLGDGSTVTYYVDRFTSTCTDTDGNILADINEYREELVYADPWDPVVIQQQVIFDSNAPLGAAYLGGIEWFTSPRPYYDQILEQTGWTENMECLAELLDDRIVGTITGKELYLIVPQEPDMTVIVWKTELNPDGELERTTELYYSDDGAPFLLKCNSNEIYSDTCVEIYDTDSTLYSWTPRLSGDDGHIVTALDEPEGGNIYDMTITYMGDVQSD